MNKEITIDEIKISVNLIYKYYNGAIKILKCLHLTDTIVPFVIKGIDDEIDKLKQWITILNDVETEIGEDCYTKRQILKWVSGTRFSETNPQGTWYKRGRKDLTDFKENKDDFWYWQIRYFQNIVETAQDEYSILEKKLLKKEGK